MRTITLDGKEYKLVPVEQETEFKEGEWVYIPARPKVWNAYLNSNYPLDKVTFPHVVQIKKMETKNYGSNGISTAIDCGKYGWNLDSIIEAGGRHATEEEIAQAQWEPNRLCLVWDDDLEDIFDVGLRFTSKIINGFSRKKNSVSGQPWENHILLPKDLEEKILNRII